MSPPTFPPQTEWPEHLFRVTSKLTWKRNSSNFAFVSPLQQLSVKELSPEDAFPRDVYFKDTVTRHLKAARSSDFGAAFNTPFISTTTSLRYALSVAELHFLRKGTDATITVIDTTLVEQRSPIWDAVQLAKLYHLQNPRANFQDEYLIFGSIKASQRPFKVVKYAGLTCSLGGFITDSAIFERENVSQARFSNFWDEIPKRGKVFRPAEVDYALRIAESISTGRLKMPLLVMVLFSKAE